MDTRTWQISHLQKGADIDLLVLAIAWDGTSFAKDPLVK